MEKQTDKPIRVLLADDHKIVRENLCCLLRLELDFEVVGLAENGQQAIDLARQCSPEVVIMDIEMPVMDGTEATRILTKEMPQVKVIALSAHVERDAVSGIREAGAAAYLTKGIAAEELVAAIRACHERPLKDLQAPGS